SLRQNTPIAPALKLGAGRVLVVGLRTPKPVSAPRAGRQDAEDQRAFSSPLYLFGKLLDALLLDRVENDLANLRQVNAALHELAQLGERDAAARKDELEEFLANPAVAPVREAVS